MFDAGGREAGSTPEHGASDGRSGARPGSAGPGPQPDRTGAGGALVAAWASVPGGAALARLLADLSSPVGTDGTVGTPDPTGLHRLLDRRRPDEATEDHDAAGLVAEEREAALLAAAPIEMVVELAAAYRRLESWAAARTAAVAAELARRPEMNPLDRRAVPTATRTASALRAPTVAGTELALRLGMSRVSARRLVAVGTALDGVLGATGRALAEGVIDWPKACALAESLAGVPWQVAHAVEDRVLPRAPRRTPGDLRRDIAAALIEVDPEDARQRRRRARAGRRVEHARPLPEGMALIRAILPAEAAVRLDVTLQAAAAHAKAAGDPRTVDQVRADALDTLATTAWRAGVIGPDHPTGDRVAPDGAAPATTPPVAEPPGSGPVDGPHPFGPWAPDRPPAPMRLSHPHRGAQLHVTVDLPTLLGLRDRAAEVRGYGPVPAEVARALATDATWRRLVTEPLSGMVLDVGTTRYRPPANLTELVRLRHPRCVSPGCAVPAHHCDTDHVKPWDPGGDAAPAAGTPDADAPEAERTGDDHASGAPRGGRTSAANLAPLCRTDHLLKTLAGFRLSQPRPGRFELTTPAGHTYRTGDGPDPPF